MTQNITKFIFLGALLHFFFVNAGSACSCKAKPEISVMDLNDAELIFTASLEEYSLGMSAGSLKFQTKRVFKGDSIQNVTIYFKLKDTHTLFSKSVKFEEKKDWIVFAHKKVAGDRTYFRLIESENSSFCALSRPLAEKLDDDNYLKYLQEMGKQADGYKRIFIKDTLLAAEGNYKNNEPIELWKYYHSNGKMNISGNYESAKREGEWQKYTTNSKGKNIVIQKRFYAKGELKEIHDLKYSGAISFKKMLSDTTEIRYYLFEDGSINSITHRNKDDDSMNTVSYYQNGGIREKKYFIGEKLMYKYQFDESGQKVSEWVREN